MSINHQQINKSQTKQQFSFPKNERFPKVKASYCNNGFYQIPETKMKRSTTFGYGIKLDFTQTKEDFMKKRPHAYELESDFNIQKKKGFSLGIGRDSAIAFDYVKTSKTESVGPGKYKPEEFQTIFKQDKSKGWSLGQKTVNIASLTTQRFNPPIGLYNPLNNLDPKGKYFDSKFRNSGACFFSPSKSQRFPKQRNNSPGPGRYNSETIQDQNGKSFISQIKSVPGTKFGNSKRPDHFISKENLKFPGPTSYALYSEFTPDQSYTISNQTTTRFNKRPQNQRQNTIQ